MKVDQLLGEDKMRPVSPSPPMDCKLSPLLAAAAAAIFPMHENGSNKIYEALLSLCFGPLAPSLSSLPASNLINFLPVANGILNPPTSLAPSLNTESLSKREPTRTPPKSNIEKVVPNNDKEGWCRNKKYISKIPGGFMCTVCRKVYGRYNSVSYHVTIYHRNPPIACGIPGCEFTTREARYIHFHKYYRHGIELPQSIDLGSRRCPFCRHVSKSPAMLDKHMARHETAKQKEVLAGGREEKGEAAPFNDADMATQEEDEQKPSTTSHLDCPDCSYRARDRDALVQHKIFAHSTELFIRGTQQNKCIVTSTTSTVSSAIPFLDQLLPS